MVVLAVLVLLGLAAVVVVLVGVQMLVAVEVVMEELLFGLFISF